MLKPEFSSALRTSVRRQFSIGCLLLAWLCANGAVWNVVQVVAWAKMVHDYSQVMPVAQALTITFDGSLSCHLCSIAQQAQDATREQLPHEARLGGSDKFFLAQASAAEPLCVPASEISWPGVAHDVGLTRTDPVRLTPPRV